MSTSILALEQRNVPPDLEALSARALAELCPALFRGVDCSAIDALALMMRPQSYRHRAKIYRAGDEADNVFVIKTGHVRLTRTAVSGRSIAIDVCGPGDVLGETALFIDQRDFNAGALGPVSVWRFPVADVLRTVGGGATFGVNLAMIVNDRLSRLSSALEDVACVAVSRRLLSLFERLAEAHGTKVERGRWLGLNLTHEDIASLIGSTRETVSSLIASLKRSGILVSDGKRIIIVESLGAVTRN